MAYVKTTDLIGATVQLLATSQTIQGNTFEAGAILEVVGLVKEQSNKHELRMRDKNGRVLLCWRKRVKIIRVPAEVRGC